MCGRFSLFKISEFLQKYNFEENLKLKPRYNIAPSQEVPVIKDGNLEFLKWGLPFSRSVINTRVETYQEKPFFNHMERILVPADGFYEWKEGQPFRIETDEVFTMAGVTWKSGFSIITLPASKDMKKVHDRMPAVLTNEKHWIKDGKLDVENNFKFTRISKLINNPKNESEKVLV